MIDLMFKEDVYNIIGVCMSVYNNLGYGFLEVVYKDAMEIEFIANQMEHIREQELPIIYKGRKLKRTFFTDFTLFDKIIVEVKANPEGVNDLAVVQTLNYLKASGNRVGLIVNFGKQKLDYKRAIF